MEELQITGLTEKDYESVNKAYHKLHEEHVKGRPDIYTETRELLTKEEFQEIVKSEEYVAVGAKKQEELAGFVIAKRKVTPENPMLKKNHTLYIDAIYVMEKFRKQGVGRSLYSYLEVLAEKESLQRIDLKVWAFNAGAVAFYESLGFQVQSFNMERRF